MESSYSARQKGEKCKDGKIPVSKFQRIQSSKNVRVQSAHWTEIPVVFESEREDLAAKGCGPQFSLEQRPAREQCLEAWGYARLLPGSV